MPSKIDQSESSSSNLEEKVMDLRSNGANGSGKVEIDEDLHKRQLAVYGRETMRRLLGHLSLLGSGSCIRKHFCADARCVGEFGSCLFCSRSFCLGCENGVALQKFSALTLQKTKRTADEITKCCDG